jgi:hypothetical protein
VRGRVGDQRRRRFEKMNIKDRMLVEIMQHREKAEDIERLLERLSEREFDWENVTTEQEVAILSILDIKA